MFLSDKGIHSDSFIAFYHSTDHPLSVIIAFSAAVSLARFVEPSLQVLPMAAGDRAFISDSRLAFVRFGQPCTITSAFIVPVNERFTSALHEVKVVSICEVTFEKSNGEYIECRLEQP